MRNRTHTITADVDVPEGVVPNGVLLAMGAVIGGFALYLLDGRLRYVHNLYGKQRTVIGSDTVIPPGPHRLAFAYTKTAEFAGDCSLLVDDVVVGNGSIPMFTPVRFSITGGGLTCGYERGPAVGDDYTAPFPVNVSIARVVVDVSGTEHRDPENEFKAMMAEQ